MTDKPKTSAIVETLPSIANGISAIASANAPFIYFEDAVFFGLMNGIGKVALQAGRQISQDGQTVLMDRVLVGHLVGNLVAIRSLRAALDGILLMAQPVPEGPSN